MPREPARAARRPEGMRRLVRPLAAFAFSVGLSSVPLATVSACSCAMTEFGEAIRTADVAIVGTPVGSTPLGKGDVGEQLLTTWSVERSRDPVEASRVDIRNWADSGANCGISFGMNERWLVLAYAADGGLETNGCMQNRRLDGSDPDAEAVIATALTEVPAGDGSGQAGIDIPGPILAIVATAIVLGAVSVLAFRRSAAS